MYCAVTLLIIAVSSTALYAAGHWLFEASPWRSKRPNAHPPGYHKQTLTQRRNKKRSRR